MRKNTLRPVNEYHYYKRSGLHFEDPGMVYFITSRAADGIKFNNDSKEIIFRSVLFLNNVKYKLFSLVVMKDHIHVIIQPLSKSDDYYYSLAEIMHSIKSYSANRINGLLGRTGKVWQPENFDRVIRDEKELMDKIKYIYYNPVKSGLIDEPDEYKWLFIAKEL